MSAIASVELTDDLNRAMIAGRGLGMTATLRYSILITDDDRGVRDALGEIVEEEGFRPVLASHGEEAVEIVQAEPIHLALLDMHMPRLTGLETLQLVRQFNALLPAILITADATRELMRQAFNAHVFSVLPKPVNRNMVLTTMLRALDRVYGIVNENEPDTNPTSGETSQ
jgi:DNA-binding NtrC family response regulator